ncbi:Trans-3-hydroxy-L-proline dehydratase [Seminavis robusta]|uniref:Trans-3-hydroxy-L-proline dehydratase n=1 Tax=Seminavis robusta TaxID=568900 RepID=A0A9N8HN77_9STRA|nr:Trans-3-hydroxy-L-proline dehydratase [Seminavis robusta]|eukprot:Sro1186_g250310.1 Trans-3-hydroxy-L-proline dehydratase (389) ;mRNA; f:15923-17089
MTVDEDSTNQEETNSTGISFSLPSRLFQQHGNKTILHCIDCHAGGEPARVVLSGVNSIPPQYETALQKRNYMMEHLDHFRKLLLLEPRGYPCQNVNFVFAPSNNGNNYQYVIGEQNKIYPLMSGHNTICVATALLECGVIPMISPSTQFTLEAPAGPINITARCHDQKVTSITLQNAPSFVEKLNVTVQVPHGVGDVQCDIAYGGMWYAVVNLSNNASLKHLKLHPDNAAELCRVGEMIKVACREQHPVQHPTVDYPGVDILVFRETPTTTIARNTVVMSNTVLDWDKPETWTAMLDRSPCGTGTCAVMAVLHARGELQVGEPFVHESIVGTQFVGTIVQGTTVSSEEDHRPAIIPQVEGSAYITQYSQVVLDPEDPFPEGYRVADIW